jgi:hypothetical protein
MPCDNDFQFTVLDCVRASKPIPMYCLSETELSCLIGLIYSGNTLLILSWASWMAWYGRVNVWACSVVYLWYMFYNKPPGLLNIRR